MTKAALGFFFVGLFCLGMAGCGGAGVSKANYDRIRYAMTPTEVESMLGESASFSEFDRSEFSHSTLQGYNSELLANISRLADKLDMKIWGTRDKYILVMFMDGQAVAKKHRGL